MPKKLTEEQTERLRKFAREHGRNWRSKLRAMWMIGRDAEQPDGHLLRQVRNTIGPSGLDRVKL